jgi:hypothetical protein
MMRPSATHAAPQYVDPRASTCAARPSSRAAGPVAGDARGAGRARERGRVLEALQRGGAEVEDGRQRAARQGLKAAPRRGGLPLPAGVAMGIERAADAVLLVVTGNSPPAQGRIRGVWGAHAKARRRRW